MILLQTILLAIVQGLTEFLPVSSDGHLVVVEAIFDHIGHPIPNKLAINILLHLGTLLAIVVVFWSRLMRLLGEDRRAIGLLLVSTLPAVLAGLLLKRYATSLLENPIAAGLGFLVTGGLLLWSARIPPGRLDCRQMSYSRALMIGVFQAFAPLPGVSRSCSTIVAGLAVGLKRGEAATFSFLMAVPVIAGAGLLETVDMWKQPGAANSLAIAAVGGLVSFAVGILALWWLIRWVQQGRLHWFAWWVLPMAALVLAWQLLLTDGIIR